MPNKDYVMLYSNENDRAPYRIDKSVLSSVAHYPSQITGAYGSQFYGDH